MIGTVANTGALDVNEAAALDFRPLNPYGAEVDLDLSRLLMPHEQDALRRLFFEHGLLVFRRQKLSMNDQMQIVGCLGPILALSAGYLSPEDGILNTRHLDFHSDLCATPLPFDVISLHAQDVNEGHTVTKFASGRRAYAQLEAEMQKHLQSLEMTMVQTVADKTRLTYDVPAEAMSLVRPVLLKHRVTGEPILYCSESATARIENVSRKESAALLAHLSAYLYAPDNIYLHVWHNGDLVIWDNLALQHGRDSVPQGERRRMQRVVAGLKTLREQVPEYNLTPVMSEVTL